MSHFIEGIFSFQLNGLIKTVYTRAKTICDKEYFENEQTHLKTALIKNGYSNKQILKILNRSDE